MMQFAQILGFCTRSMHSWFKINLLVAGSSCFSIHLVSQHLAATRYGTRKRNDKNKGHQNIFIIMSYQITNQYFFSTSNLFIGFLWIFCFIFIFCCSFSPSHALRTEFASCAEALEGGLDKAFESVVLSLEPPGPSPSPGSKMMPPLALGRSGNRRIEVKNSNIFEPKLERNESNLKFEIGLLTCFEPVFSIWEPFVMGCVTPKWMDE